MYEYTWEKFPKSIPPILTEAFCTTIHALLPLSPRNANRVDLDAQVSFNVACSNKADTRSYECASAAMTPPAPGLPFWPALTCKPSHGYPGARLNQTQFITSWLRAYS